MQRALEDVAAKIAPIHARLPEVHQRMLDGCGGYPPTGTGSGISGSTGASPVEHQAFTPDPARDDLAQLSRLIDDLHRTALALGAVYGRWTPQMHPCQAGCTECGSRPAWRSDGGGHLRTPQCLCRPCREFVQVVGRLPTKPEVKAGRRVLV